jgi:hypothetical protein
MLIEIKRVLREGGVLIMSSPDKKYYTDEMGFTNEFHVKELYFPEFQQLISAHFKYCIFLKQRFMHGSLIVAEVGRNELQIHSGNYMELNAPTHFTPMYNLVIASDHTLDEPLDSIFTADEWYRTEINNLTSKIKSSLTWKIGSFFVKPMSYLKTLLKNN